MAIKLKSSLMSEVTIMILFAIFFVLVLLEFVSAIDKDPGYHAGPDTDRTVFVDRR